MTITFTFSFNLFGFSFLGHFSWEKYLKETGAIAAPSSYFRQVNIVFLYFPQLWCAVTPQLILFCHLHLEPRTSDK